MNLKISPPDAQLLIVSSGRAASKNERLTEQISNPY